MWQIQSVPPATQRLSMSTNQACMGTDHSKSNVNDSRNLRWLYIYDIATQKKIETCRNLDTWHPEICIHYHHIIIISSIISWNHCSSLLLRRWRSIDHWRPRQWPGIIRRRVQGKWFSPKMGAWESNMAGKSQYVCKWRFTRFIAWKINCKWWFLHYHV